MSRPIKFRMWSKKANKFFYDVENVYECLMQQHVYDGTQPTRKTIVAYNHKADGMVWEQSVGLKDRNGKEIWEGDVVNNSAASWVVKFNSGCFCGDMIKPEPLTAETLIALRAIREIFVIGNIHQNPELLKP